MIKTEKKLSEKLLCVLLIQLMVELLCVLLIHIVELEIPLKKPFAKTVLVEFAK